MSAEGTDVDMKEVELTTVEPTEKEQEQEVAVTEAEQEKEAELTEVEQEKQPMNGGGEEAANGDAASSPAAERNGTATVKIPDGEPGATFTGLSKEELMRVAGTPGWVRTRGALLALFWLGWLGMLAGAVVIILQAPRCRPYPAVNWWNKGPLYQIGDVPAFSENLEGLQQKVAQLSKLKLKALVVGPLHVAPADQPLLLDFRNISPEVGNLQQFSNLLQAVHKKNMFLVLDLTPNYRGNQPWFSNVTMTTVAEEMKSALMFWLERGVDGVQLSGVEQVSGAASSLWADIRAIVQNHSTDASSKKVLVGVTDQSSGPAVSALLASSGVDLLLSDLLRSTTSDATERAQSVQLLYSAHPQSKLAWNLGGRSQGHLASLVGSAGVKAHQILLSTLPGTPVFNYGDEIGLLDEKDTTFPRMLWDSAEPEPGLNATEQEEWEQRSSFLQAFRVLVELRGGEPSLLYGDLLLLHNSSSSLAYARVWDQSLHYVAAFNWAEEGGVSMDLRHPLLAPQGTVVLSANASTAPPGTSVALGAVQLDQGQALMLKVPYLG